MSAHSDELTGPDLEKGVEASSVGAGKIQKQNSKTITSALRGAFREDPKTRDEFLRLAHNTGHQSQY